MAFESLLPLLPVSVVHAKPDAGRVTPDGQGKREKQNQRQREQSDEPAHPVLNAQGQITGKLIDTTA